MRCPRSERPSARGNACVSSCSQSCQGGSHNLCFAKPPTHPRYLPSPLSLYLVVLLGVPLMCSFPVGCATSAWLPWKQKKKKKKKKNCFFFLPWCVFQESIKAKGLRDDITVLVVDLLPSQLAQLDRNACPVPKGPSGGKSLLQRLKVSHQPCLSSLLHPHPLVHLSLVFCSWCCCCCICFFVTPCHGDIDLWQPCAPS